MCMNLVTPSGEQCRYSTVSRFRRRGLFMVFQFRSYIFPVIPSENVGGKGLLSCNLLPKLISAPCFPRRALIKRPLPPFVTDYHLIVWKEVTWVVFRNWSIRSLSLAGCILRAQNDRWPILDRFRSQMDFEIERKRGWLREFSSRVTMLTSVHVKCMQSEFFINVCKFVRLYFRRYLCFSIA